MPLTRAYPLPSKWDIYISLHPLERALPFPPKVCDVNNKIDASNVGANYM